MGQRCSESVLPMDLSAEPKAAPVPAMKNDGNISVIHWNERSPRAKDLGGKGRSILCLLSPDLGNIYP